MNTQELVAAIQREKIAELRKVEQDVVSQKQGQNVKIENLRRRYTELEQRRRNASERTYTDKSEETQQEYEKLCVEVYDTLEELNHLEDSDGEHLASAQVSNGKIEAMRRHCDELEQKRRAASERTYTDKSEEAQQKYERLCVEVYDALEELNQLENSENEESVSIPTQSSGGKLEAARSRCNSLQQKRRELSQRVLMENTAGLQEELDKLSIEVYDALEELDRLENQQEYEQEPESDAMKRFPPFVSAYKDFDYSAVVKQPRVSRQKKVEASYHFFHVCCFLSIFFTVLAIVLWAVSYVLFEILEY
jgi:chromosome segregation ATPase